MRPRLLDLFCGAGGAAMGYHRAGFEVVGVDINPQPHYPFEFHQADALTFPLDGFDAIHASPPCQAYSATAHFSVTGTNHPQLVEPTRELLVASRLPWVIENVVGAPLLSPVRLCGSSFGLRVWRHRLFEMSDPPLVVPPCSHYFHPEPLDVTGTGAASVRPRLSGGGRSRKPAGVTQAREAMGIDWMSRKELAQAIPPAYAEWIGRQLIQAVERAA